MPFSWSQYNNENPAVILSPMSGYTDSPFKQIVRSVSPKTVLMTEFLSVDAIYYQSDKTFRMMEFAEEETPVILQVFGKEPERFVHAAKIAEKMGYDGIDINMGCPAKKVIRSDHGSALVKIKNRCVAMDIVAAMASSVKIPVSVKTRIGWDNFDDLIDFSKALERHGCAALSVHGRTTKQAYLGKANWDPIYELKKHLSIPVFGNGDVTSVATFREKLGPLDGVLIGRGSFGDPWIFRDVHEYIDHPEQYADMSDEELDTVFPRAGKIDWEFKKPIIHRHAELQVQCHGEELGMLEIRKHLAAYIKGIDGASKVRAKLMQVKKLEEIKELVEGL
ncbi:MAG: tRNA-dihydrouridine synthase [Candidatus Gracilibacteria bacterium]|nr:tRNA-dihydrouridine synthase [Candidatus Gracilibacteria bacterium]